MSKHNDIEGLCRSESGQFVLVAQVPGQKPKILSEKPTAFRAGLNQARNIAKELKSTGAKTVLTYLPEVFVYDVTPPEENGESPYKIVLAPVEYYGITPEPKPEKLNKETKPEGEKKRGGRNKKVVVEDATTGSETIPTSSESVEGEG